MLSISLHITRPHQYINKSLKRQGVFYASMANRKWVMLSNNTYLNWSLIQRDENYIKFIKTWTAEEEVWNSNWSQMYLWKVHYASAVSRVISIFYHFVLSFHGSCLSHSVVPTSKKRLFDWMVFYISITLRYANEPYIIAVTLYCVLLHAKQIKLFVELFSFLWASTQYQPVPALGSGSPGSYPGHP